MKQHRLYRRTSQVIFFAAFALLALCQPEGVSAQWVTNGTNTTTTNSVGIGTASPASPLEIQAPDAPITLSQAGVAAKSTVQSAVGTDLHMSANAKWSDGGWNRYDTTMPSWNFFLAPGTGADYAGIRRAAPGVGGIVWTDFFRVTNTGNIGIGTATPGVLNGINYAAHIPLHVRAAGGAVASLLVDSASSASGFVINDSSQPLNNRIWSMSQVAGGGKLTFAAITDAGVGTNHLVIDRLGSVGVGTSAPAAKLHVAGDIRVDGNISAKYQDVAEWVPTLQAMPAGTVVILDIERDNHVTASTRSYDTRVAGVVSAQPGLSLGEAGDGKALVATTGRVKVRVDATRAPIKIGDLLVTGETPGVAMRSQPLELGGVQLHRPGTLIGKALQSLNKGTGEILVLLSLQ